MTRFAIIDPAKREISYREAGADNDISRAANIGNVDHGVYRGRRQDWLWHLCLRMVAVFGGTGILRNQSLSLQWPPAPSVYLSRVWTIAAYS
jgi:hypothetical protein